MEALAIIISMIVMFLWLRTESNADRRQINTNMDVTRAESCARTDALRAETNALIRAIHDEIKDFHGRLCAIEERRK